MHPTFAEDVEPYEPPRAAAPLDVSKHSLPDTEITGKELKREISSEFGGILYMALRKYSYEKWPGKEMSDCYPAKSEAGWCYQCQMITGHASAYYFFYRDPGQKSCTLQQVDVQFEVGDPGLIKDLKRPVRSLFGSEVYEEKPRVRADQLGVSGPAWRWTTDRDLAYLYMDGHQGNPIVRFQWERAPLFN